MELTQVFVGAACSGVLGLAGWFFHLGNRVTRLETSREHDSSTMTKIEGGVTAISNKLDAFVLAMVKH